MNNYKLPISLAANAVFLAAVVLLIWKYGIVGKIVDRVLPSSKMERIMRQEKKDLTFYLSTMQGRPVKSIFLGDSITRIAAIYFPGYLGRGDMVFAGVDGDGVGGVLDRVDEIIAIKPERIFLMVGVNDLRSGRKAEEVIVPCGRLIDRIIEAKIRLIIQSVTPVGERDFASYINPEIGKFNEALKKIAAQKGCVYIDLWSPLLEKGYLSEKYTDDQLHLNFQGCKIWADQIKNYLD